MLQKKTSFSSRFKALQVCQFLEILQLNFKIDRRKNIKTFREDVVRNGSSIFKFHS